VAQWRNSDDRWGAVAKAFHWSLALLILGTSLFVLHVNDSTLWFTSSPEIFITYIHWHKALGLIALVLIVARIWWRRRQPVPVTAPLTPFETLWSHRVHIGLYALMIVVPVTGWLASSFFGSGTKFWGLFTIPPIVPKSKLGVAIGYWTHFVLAWTLLAIVALHVGAALYHHFVRRDRTLSAMLPGGSTTPDPSPAISIQETAR
jgi:cytochrome b561